MVWGALRSRRLPSCVAGAGAPVALPTWVQTWSAGQLAPWSGQHILHACACAQRPGKAGPLPAGPALPCCTAPRYAVQVIAHSVGTWNAYEFLRRAQRQGLPMPRKAFLSGGCGASAAPAVHAVPCCERKQCHRHAACLS